MFHRQLEPEGRQAGSLRANGKREAFSQSFYVRHGKRALDLVSSVIGLIGLVPVFVLVACCIKLTTSGPVFYRQVRLGKDGRRFRILKFRSMVVDASEDGPGITVSGDRRVTTIGRLLRRYKVDELPQLWNVLHGDMSLVGPRPELPTYVAGYTPEQRLVLAARPGITDPASLVYRYEEEILARQSDPREFYRKHILPDKLARNKAYLENITLRNDIRIVAKTILSSLLPAENADRDAPSR